MIQLTDWLVSEEFVSGQTMLNLFSGLLRYGANTEY